MRLKNLVPLSFVAFLSWEDCYTNKVIGLMNRRIPLKTEPKVNVNTPID